MTVTAPNPRPSSEPGSMCPSGRCQDGSLLIGIVAGDGRVRYLGRTQAIDEEFVETAHTGRAPEMRFRFAEPCGQGSCAQWTGHGCGLVDLVIGADPGGAGDDLPCCGIRRDCRWYYERGRLACHACPAIVHTRPGPTDDLIGVLDAPWHGSDRPAAD